jgi:hypothetical protein
MPNEETELTKFLEEAGVDTPKVEEPTEERLYDFSEKKAVVEAKADTPEDEEDDVPFHKNPKVIKYIEKREAKLRDEFEQRFNKQEPQVREPLTEDEDPLSDVLTRIIGNDTPEKLSAIKDFKKALGNMKDEAKLEALREIEARGEEETKAEIQAQNEVSEALDDIEDIFNIDITSNAPQAKKMRSDFIDFVKRVAPKDRNGDIVSYPDFKETFSVFKDMNKPQSNDRAKDLANRSISNTTVANNTQTVDSFSDMDKWLESLSN